MDTKIDTAKSVAAWTAKTLGESAALSVAQTAGVWTGFIAVGSVYHVVTKKRDERRAKKAQPAS